MATSGADPKSVLIGLQDNGTRIRVGNTSVFNQSFGGDGFGVGWSQSKNVTALGSYVYGYIYYAQMDPNIQKKWTDPAFDAKQKAFYYARVLEIPTPRWTAYDAKRFNIKPLPGTTMKLQERAYTSPIWYTPVN